MTTEPPRGIKANLQRSYNNIVTVETYNELRSGLIDGVSRVSDIGDGETSATGALLKSNSPTGSMVESPFHAVAA